MRAIKGLTTRNLPAMIQEIAILRQIIFRPFQPITGRMYGRIIHEMAHHILAPNQIVSQVYSNYIDEIPFEMLNSARNSER